MKFLSFVRLFGEHWDRGASPSGRPSRKPRAARLAKRSRLVVEALEDRSLLSVLPITDVTGHFNNIAPSDGNHSAPAVAVDPSNPKHLVAIYTRNDPANLPPKTPVIVEAASSVDGGLNWLSLFLPGTLTDPATSGTGIAPFLQETDGSVAFDANHNFYLVYAEHVVGTANGGSGAIVEQKFDFSGGAPVQTITNKIIYEWLHDPAFNPVLAVDTAPAMFQDPTTHITKTDPFSGTVYVSCSTNWVPPTPAPQNFNANSIMVVSSSDGGKTFSAPVYANDNFNFGAEHDAAPQLTVSGGTTDGRVSPGQVNIVYYDFNSGSTLTPPLDFIRYNNVQQGGCADT